MVSLIKHLISWFWKIAHILVSRWTVRTPTPHSLPLRPRWKVGRLEQIVEQGLEVNSIFRVASKETTQWQRHGDDLGPLDTSAQSNRVAMAPVTTARLRDFIVRSPSQNLLEDWGNRILFWTSQFDDLCSYTENPNFVTFLVHSFDALVFHFIWISARPRPNNVVKSSSFFVENGREARKR